MFFFKVRLIVLAVPSIYVEELQSAETIYSIKAGMYEIGGSLEEYTGVLKL